MIQLHAPDAMGQAAHKAAQVASLLDFRLLVAASPLKSREERSEALLKALTQWPSICRAMASLEAAAPTISRQAAQEAGRLQDFIETNQSA